MSIATGGIDSQIQDKMDTYRSNPNALKKAFGVSKQTVDLLALQKLTSEKKQIAADMQLKAQQQPGTIAEQREQEALELVKQEQSRSFGDLAKQTAGTLNQTASAQKQGMNKLMKNAGRKSPTGVAGLPGLMGNTSPRAPTGNPAAQGLAGARMALASKQPGGPRRMAQGGIVGFASGKKVTLSPAQEKKARKEFGDRYDRIVGPLLQMDDDDPTALAILKILGPAVQSSKISRFLEENFGDGPPGTQQDDVGRRNTLEADIRNKYSVFTGPEGLFKSQSDDQSNYAAEVISKVRDLDDATLKKLLDANFTSGMSTIALSALPVLPETDVETGAEPEPETGVDTGANTGDGSGDGSGDLLSYDPNEKRIDYLSGVDTSFELDTPEAVNPLLLDQLKTSQDALTDQASETPTRTELAPLTAASLEPVAAPYTDEEQVIAAELQKRYVADANIESGQARKDARRESDDYFGRADKAATYAQQETDLSALQSETLDPARMAQLARMRTLAGGRFGSGGIGSEYVKAELAKDKRRTTGLSDIRDIQNTGITTDVNIADRGAISGENTFQAAENRVNAGILGLQKNLQNAETRALAGQEARNAVGVANFEYQVNLGNQDYNAALRSLRANGNALTQVVKFDQQLIAQDFDEKQQRSVEENKRLSQISENKLAKAVAQTERDLSINSALLDDEVELTKLFETYRANVRTALATAMEGNPLAIKLNAQLLKLTGAENASQAEKIKKELDRIKAQLTDVLVRTVDGFSENYGGMVFMKRRIGQLQKAQTIVSDGTLSTGPRKVREIVPESEQRGPSFRR